LTASLGLVTDTITLTGEYVTLKILSQTEDPGWSYQSLMTKDTDLVMGM